MHLIRIHRLVFRFAHSKHCQSVEEVRKVDRNIPIPLAEAAAKEESAKHKCISSSTLSAVSMYISKS